MRQCGWCDWILEDENTPVPDCPTRREVEIALYNNMTTPVTTTSTLSDADRKRILDSLTQDDLQILQEAFTVYDKNHDGTITTKVC